jgi:hypothetical protein
MRKKIFAPLRASGNVSHRKFEDAMRKMLWQNAGPSRNEKSLQVALERLEELEKYFKDKIYYTKIMRNVRISESPSFGKPVVLYDPYSIGAKNYTELANEFLKRNNMGHLQRFDNILTYDAPKFETKVVNSERNEVKRRIYQNNIFFRGDEVTYFIPHGINEISF